MVQVGVLKVNPSFGRFRQEQAFAVHDLNRPWSDAAAPLAPGRLSWHADSSSQILSVRPTCQTVSSRLVV